MSRVTCLVFHPFTFSYTFTLTSVNENENVYVNGYENRHVSKISDVILSDLAGRIKVVGPDCVRAVWLNRRNAVPAYSTMTMHIRML